MNLKQAKKLRKVAKALAGNNIETRYAVLERRKHITIAGENHNYIQYQVIVHPQCYRGIYLSFKKGIRTD